MCVSMLTITKGLLIYSIRRCFAHNVNLVTQNKKMHELCGHFASYLKENMVKTNTISNWYLEETRMGKVRSEERRVGKEC